MKVDERGRAAAYALRRASTGAEPVPALDRLERTHSRQRAVTAVAAMAVAAVAIVFAVRTLGTSDERGRPATAPLPGGTILYGEWSQRIQQARWFTVRSDRSGTTDLGIMATCAEWFPDGSRILITNDAAVSATTPLRPAVVRPDGSGLRPLTGTSDPDVNLGCGDVSPDASRIVLEGFNETDPTRSGIYSVRASDGGGLVQLTTGSDSYPQYSPDGMQVVFMRTKAGVQPSGAGALFVVGADGGRAERITPWGSAFLDQAWSPDGQWITFERPYGELYLVRPDGSDLHAVPVQLPTGAGAENPSWSADGRWIVFSLHAQGRSNIFAVRPDGTGLRRITSATEGDLASPDWAP